MYCTRLNTRCKRNNFKELSSDSRVSHRIETEETPSVPKSDIFDGKIKNLDLLESVKAEYLLANNQITPFDSSKYIQTLFIPTSCKNTKEHRDGKI